MVVVVVDHGLNWAVPPRNLNLYVNVELGDVERFKATRSNGGGRRLHTSTVGEEYVVDVLGHKQRWWPDGLSKLHVDGHDFS